MNSFYKRITIVFYLLIIANLSSAQSSLVQLPYYSDFENGTNGWTTMITGDTTTKWELGAPNFGFTSTAHSGSNCWDINLDSAYHDDASCKLYSPFFNCNGISPIVISFWRNYNTELTWDGTTLYYKLNTAGPVVLDGWSGNSNGWKDSAYIINTSLSDSFQLYFVFSSDASVTGDGFSVDDFSVSSAANINEQSNQNKITVIPNVIIDFCLVTAPLFSNATIKLYDLEGSILLQDNFNLQSQLDLSSYKSGIYVIEISDYAKSSRKGSMREKIFKR